MDITNFFQNSDSASLGGGSGQKIHKVWSAFIRQLMENPSLWLSAVQEGQQKQMEIMAQLQTAPVLTPAKGDRRFNAEQWRENPLFSMLMQNYLLNSDILRALAEKADIPEQDKNILRFAVSQYIDAMSPTNFPATNPEVMEEAVQTGGESLARGMQNFLKDVQEGSMVKNTDLSAFSIGDNIATTPGKVILQTPLMQLIEYAPQTAEVHSRPLLIVPPCINKYYILDLTEQKSMVAHLVARGQRVFLMSWVNAGDEVRDAVWDDYLRDGVMAAIEAVQSVTRQAQINTMGFCIGGTLLVSALAALAAVGEQPAKSVTLLAAMLDFSDTGEIGLFIDEASVAEREAQFAGGGLMDGRALARGFAALRPNDLIWPYVIGNYYQGKTPPAFDLLFWNADSTNLPGPMFAEYLRITYLENQISRGAARMCGEEIKPAGIQADVYSVACEKDHIVPWQTAFLSAKMFGGAHRFILAASGHIAGIINPPASQKGWHLAGDTAAADADAFRAQTPQQDGSWWEDWFAFLAERGAGKTPAPARAGSLRYAAIEDAPGSYVRIPRPPADGQEAPPPEEAPEAAPAVKPAPKPAAPAARKPAPPAPPVKPAAPAAAKPAPAAAKPAAKKPAAPAAVKPAPAVKTVKPAAAKPAAAAIKPAPAVPAKKSAPAVQATEVTERPTRAHAPKRLSLTDLRQQRAGAAKKPAVPAAAKKPAAAKPAKKSAAKKRHPDPNQ